MQIEILSKHPGVKNIRKNRITFTYDFKCKMYEYWLTNPCAGTIRKFLTENGIHSDLISNKRINHLNEKLKINGKPTGGRNQVFGLTGNTYRTTDEISQYLLSTGKFTKYRNGIVFSPEFIKELYHEYPQVSIEDGLDKNNIDSEKVGYQRIYQLKLLFDGKKSNILERNTYSEEMINIYSNHPYVKRISKTQFVLEDKFYKEALFLNGLSIDEILEIFCIDYHDLNISLKNRIKNKLSSWESKDKELSINEFDSLYIQIQRNKNASLKKLIDENFEKVKIELPTYPKLRRKALCKWISSLPKDDEYSISSVLEKVGISRSSYYSILKNDNYGMNELKKEKQDEKDIVHIQNVIKYRDIPKGSRMICMMLPRLEGVKMSRNKILRLMRKYDLTCKVRESKESRIEYIKLIDENKKDNLLKRRFRLCRPLEVMLTDVSYLKYGSNETAYLSCVKDSSSGRILSVAVSDSQDLLLADETLEGLNQFELKENGIFHSDQGSLYLASFFQSRIKEMKLRQSMSRRGNCWDNASQESFFGHFKDECDYSSCIVLDDVVNKVKNYIEYYNNERPQWTRKKMTPVEFEKYLLEMSEGEFNDYHKIEKEKYELMKEKAIEKAKKRMKDLGAV